MTQATYQLKFHIIEELSDLTDTTISSYIYHVSFITLFIPGKKIIETK